MLFILQIAQHSPQPRRTRGKNAAQQGLWSLQMSLSQALRIMESCMIWEQELFKKYIQLITDYQIIPGIGAIRLFNFKISCFLFVTFV